MWRTSSESREVRSSFTLMQRTPHAIAVPCIACTRTDTGALRKLTISISHFTCPNLDWMACIALRNSPKSLTSGHTTKIKNVHCLEVGKFSFDDALCHEQHTLAASIDVDNVGTQVEESCDVLLAVIFQLQGWYSTI